MYIANAVLDTEAQNSSADNHTQELALAYILSAPIAKAELKNLAEDFQVEEKLKFDLTGEGQHLCLFIEKKYLNTLDVLEVLARFFQVPGRSIGYFGLKDKNALTRQWFSVDMANSPFDDSHCRNFAEQYTGLLRSITDNSIPTIRIIESKRNIKKFKIGQHGANGFRIVLRNIQGQVEGATWADLKNDLENRLQHIHKNGFANYFGEQRFGLKNQLGERQNVVSLKKHAHSDLSKNRQLRSRLISTLRSLVFNQYLSMRIQQNSYQTYIKGDVLQFSDGRSLLRVNQEDKETSSKILQKRLDEKEVVVTGPMPGANASMASEQSLLLEESVQNNFQDYHVLLKNNDVNSGRRVLISFPDNMSWCFEDHNLVLGFELGAGSYATALVREIINV